MRSSNLILVLAVFLAACENPLEHQEQAPGELISTSQDLFNGEILENKAVKLDDVDVWKIKIENRSGAVVSFFWRKSYFNLFRIVGEEGPYDYNIKPPFDVLNFRTAKFLAFNDNNPPQLNSWKFMRNPGEMKWFYLFFYDDSSATILVDAGSGEIVR